MKTLVLLLLAIVVTYGVDYTLCCKPVEFTDKECGQEYSENRPENAPPVFYLECFVCPDTDDDFDFEDGET